MPRLKAFVNIQAMVSNEPGAVAPLGELSTWSLTFSKDTGLYSTPLVPGYHLAVFHATDSDEAPILVNGPLVTLSLQLSQHLVQAFQVHTAPYDLVALRSGVYAEFPDAIRDLVFGPLVTDGERTLPEWIQWTAGQQYPATDVTLWYADAAFASQYSAYSITVIPPLTPLDGFFAAHNTVLSQLAARTLPQLFEQLQTEKARHPETYVRALTIPFIPVNEQPPVPTTWAVLIYGEAGNTPDAIKDALVDYVLTHSDHPRAEWELRLPELFQRTEFLILPRWDLYSIPNMTVQTGLYASMVDPLEAVAFAKQYAADYTDAHVASNTTLLPYDYKAIMLCIVNGPTNAPAAARIQQLFPDYVPVASTTLDFNRMQPATRGWVLFLEAMLLVAETMTSISTLPAPLRRATRDGIPYLAADYGDIQYLMLPKYWILDHA